MKTLLTLSSEQGIDIPWERTASAGSDIQYGSHKSFDYIIDIENVHFAVKVTEKPIVDIVLALYL